MVKVKKPFIQYWFVWNGWGNHKGRRAKCCSTCTHYDDEKECTEGICEYCGLHNIQVRTDLVCDNHNWIPSEKSMWDDQLAINQSIMEAAHLYDWNELECPMCNPNLYYRIVERCTVPMIPLENVF
jgi:hypothetical protein